MAGVGVNVAGAMSVDVKHPDSGAAGPCFAAGSKALQRSQNLRTCPKAPHRDTREKLLGMAALRPPISEHPGSCSLGNRTGLHNEGPIGLHVGSKCICEFGMLVM